MVVRRSVRADIKSVVDVLRSPFLTQGPVVPQFEEHVAPRFVLNLVLQLIVLLVPSTSPVCPWAWV